MRLLTASSHSATILPRWNKQYAHYQDNYRLHDGRSVGEIRRALESLPVPINPDDVTRVIGNNGWSYPECDLCGNRCNAVAEFTREHESAFYICQSCCDVANRILKSDTSYGTSIFDEEPDNAQG